MGAAEWSAAWAAVDAAWNAAEDAARSEARDAAVHAARSAMYVADAYVTDSVIDDSSTAEIYKISGTGYLCKLINNKWVPVTKLTLQQLADLR